MERILGEELAMTPVQPPPRKELQGKTILGIDYGTKVIGLAKYTFDRDPFPLLLGRIVNKTQKQVLDELKVFIEDEFVDLIVLGLPLYLDGNESNMTKEVRGFAQELGIALSHIPIFFQDEGLSSFEAEERMKKDPRFSFKVDMKTIDAVAASIIIEQFLSEKILD